MIKSKDEDIKAFNVRLPKDLWLFLKKQAMEHEVSMNTILFKCVERCKKDMGKILTDI